MQSWITAANCTGETEIQIWRILKHLEEDQLAYMKYILGLSY